MIFSHNSLNNRLMYAFVAFNCFLNTRFINFFHFFPLQSRHSRSAFNVWNAILVYFSFLVCFAKWNIEKLTFLLLFGSFLSNESEKLWENVCMCACGVSELERCFDWNYSNEFLWLARLYAIFSCILESFWHFWIYGIV